MTTTQRPLDDYERRYQIEADVRTLAEARKIEADPKRFRAAKAAARAKIAEMQGMLDDEKAEGE